MKKLIILTSILLSTILGKNIAMADTTTQYSTQERMQTVLSNFKDSDKILKLSTNVYVHGKVSISDLSRNSKGPLNLDSNSDPRAKSVKDVKEGSLLEEIQVPQSPLGVLAAPTQIMNLGVGAGASGRWVPLVTGYQYTPYTYQPVPLGTSDLLRWSAYWDSIYIGGSERWHNPTSGIVVTRFTDRYIGDAAGNISAAWTQYPFEEGASWYVGNV